MLRADAAHPAGRARRLVITLAALSLGVFGFASATTAAPPAPPDDLGDDPELDALAEACYGGDLLACDHLFLRAPVGSAYEEYGDTCAGRQPAGTANYCALGGSVPGGGTTPPDTGVTAPTTTVVPGPGVIPAPTVEPTGLGDDPLLDALAEECYGGDMAACDDLYRQAELDSAYMTYADTCAGRQPEGSNRWCVDAFAAAAPTTVPTPTVPTTSTAPVPPVPPVTPTVPSLPPLPSIVLPSLPPLPTIAVPTIAVPTIVAPTTEPGLGVIPPPTLLPTGLGTDPALDQLAQVCYDGSMEDCDQLYIAAEMNSAYHQFADTCAGRQPPATGLWCTEAFPGAAGTTLPGTTLPGGTLPGGTVPGAVPPASQPPTGLGTDAALDVLAFGCYNGDMAACDSLYDTAPVGSPYQAYADTCAGRQPELTYRYCQDSFPASGQPRPGP